MDAHALLQQLAGERARFVGLVRRRVGSAAEAEDVVQHALVRAAERAASVADPTRARAWFYRLLRNAVVDHQRARGPLERRGEAEPDELAAEVAPPTSVCACGPRLLDGLRPNYAEVLRRIDLEGEAPRDAAAALGITEGNLDVRLHRARKSLREEVHAYCAVRSLRPCLDCACDSGRRCGSA